MTVQIRSSVFETNSSSSHSLTLGKSMLAPLIATKKELTTGKIVVELHSYNWEWARYYDAREKIAYLASQLALRNQKDDDTFNAEIEEDSKLGMLRQAVKRQTGCDLVFANVLDAGIDHESVGLGMDLFSSMEKLEAFLWDSTAFIETGNDNDPAPNWIRVGNTGKKEWYGQPSMLKEKAIGQEVTFKIEKSKNHHSFLVHAESNRILAAHPAFRDLLLRILACPVGMAKMRFEECLRYKRYHRPRCTHQQLVSILAQMQNLNEDYQPVPCAIDVDFIERSSSESVFVDKEYRHLNEDITVSFVLPQSVYDELMALPPLTKAQTRLLDLLVTEPELRANVEAGWGDKSRLKAIHRKIATLGHQKVRLPLGAQQ